MFRSTVCHCMVSAVVDRATRARVKGVTGVCFSCPRVEWLTRYHFLEGEYRLSHRTLGEKANQGVTPQKFFWGEPSNLSCINISLTVCDTQTPSMRISLQVIGRGMLFYPQRNGLIIQQVCLHVPPKIDSTKVVTTVKLWARRSVTVCSLFMRRRRISVLEWCELCSVATLNKNVTSWDKTAVEQYEITFRNHPNECRSLQKRSAASKTS